MKIIFIMIVILHLLACALISIVLVRPFINDVAYRKSMKPYEKENDMIMKSDFDSGAVIVITILVLSVCIDVCAIIGILT